MTRPGGWVLVADDDDDLRSLVGLILADRGYSTFGARDGVDALEQLRQHPTASLVLLDLMMPRMDGSEVVRHIKNDERLCAIPVVIFSGDKHAEEIAAETKAEALLVKPVDLDQLLQVVGQLTTSAR